MTAASLQEIICCIGHPVAANPTQYVIEQALVAAGLDFRCLTLDVHPDHLQDAVAGMRAMGFLGAIFAHPHQVEIGQYLDEVEDLARQASYVDFAMRIGDQLCGQSTLGAAIAELLTKLERMPKSAVVFGTAPREQLIAAQLVSLGISTTLVDVSEVEDSEKNEEVPSDQQDGVTQAGDESEVAGAVSERDQPAEDQGDEPQHTAEDIEDVAAKGEFSESAGLPAEPARASCVMQAEYESQPQAADLVITSSAEISPVVMTAALQTAPAVAMDLTEEPVPTDFLRQAKMSGCVVFNSVDIRLTSLVIAFRRWTNTEPDDSIMRDALEEFLLV